MIDRPSIRIALLGAALLIVAAPGLATAKQFSGWGLAVAEAGINTGAIEGCPIESPNGLELYIASNRAGSVSEPNADPNDIWVATRTSKSASWTTPVNLGMPVNSTAADYCPTPLTGKRLLFVSTRTGAGTGACGGGDIYLTRRNPAHGWEEPVNLGCAPDGPNSAGGEFGPSLVETAEGTFLYFSSNRAGTQDIYVSRMGPDWTFGPATIVTELSTAFDDFMPNVSRNGLEIVLNSNRPGLDTFGGQDIYIARRASTAVVWGPPVNLGPNVNTTGSETRSSLSGDGARLHFGRSGDIYVSTRVKVSGQP